MWKLERKKIKRYEGNLTPSLRHDNFQFVIQYTLSVEVEMMLFKVQRYFVEIVKDLRFSTDKYV